MFSKKEIVGYVLAGIIGFIIGMVLSLAGNLTIDFIKTKPLIEVNMQTTNWENLENAVKIPYLHSNMIISSGGEPFDERKVLLFFKPIKGDTEYFKEFWPIFDYNYMKDCRDCYQNWVRIKNQGKVKARDIEIFIHDKFDLLEITKKDLGMEYELGESIYSNKGVILKIEELGVGEEILFSFVTSEKINFVYDCEVKENSNFCKGSILETHVLDLSQMEKEGLDRIHFNNYNTTLVIPYMNKSEMFLFNFKTGKMEIFEGDLIDVNEL